MQTDKSGTLIMPPDMGVQEELTGCTSILYDVFGVKLII